MSVWFCIPSKRPATEVEPVLKLWKDRGYRIALCVDDEADADAKHDMADVIISSPDGYRGWPRSVNGLIQVLKENGSDFQWIVTGGDDTHPDPNHEAEEIAAQCFFHFAGDTTVAGWRERATFGVMQCTGDRWGEDDPVSRARWPEAPAMIDRICGSPWIGREFALRINGGQGPLWHEYRHNWADEELQCVAQSLGVLWQRRDLIHYHAHSMRLRGKWDPHQHWFGADYREKRALFEQRKKMGFPGSAPL